MLRTWLGVVVGLLLGLGLGFVLFSSSGSRETPGPSRASMPREVQASEAAAPSLLSPPRSVHQASSAAPALQHAAPRPVSTQRVQEVLSRVALSPDAVRNGELEIWGRVLDENDMGLAGAVLRATGNDAKRALKRPGDEGLAELHQTLEDSMREAAQRFQETNARRFQATSDAQGYYRISGLPEGSFHVQGFLQSYRLDSQRSKSQSVPAGNEVNFRAKPTVAVSISIELPDGTLPQEALIQCDQVIEGNSSYELWEWTPTENVLQLPANDVTLSAYAGIPAFISRIDNSASMRSEPRQLELRRGAPQSVHFKLESRSGIRGQVSFSEDIVTPDRVFVRMLSMGSETNVNLELLSKAESLEHVQNLGEFAFLELEPGRYAVGLCRDWNSPIVAHQVLELERGIARCNLTLPPIDPAEFIATRVLGPDGKPLRGVRLRIKREIENGGSNTSSLNASLGNDGRYYAAVPENLHSSYYGEPGAGVSFSLEATHQEYGSQSVVLAPAQSEAELSFVPPASLEVMVLGLSGSEYQGRATVFAKSTLDTRQRNYDNSQVDAMGSYKLPALTPGEYDIQLMIGSSGQRHGSTSVVQTKRVNLVAGPNHVELSLPRLYSLDVVVPEPKTGMRLGMGIEDPETKSLRINNSVECDAEGNARFSALVAGEYTLMLWGANESGRMQVTIPSGAIVFRADSD